MKHVSMKIKAPRNRTISISPDEQNKFIKSLLHPNSILTNEQAQNKIINEDIFETIDFLPDHFIDLLFVDNHVFYFMLH